MSEAREKGVELGVVCGRYYAMDRDRNYDRTQLAYNALVFGDAPVKGLLEGIDESYKEGITDEFVKPYIVTKGEKGSLQRYVEFKNLCFVQMMLYSEKVKGEVAFGLQELDNMYGDVISNLGLKQLRIAETEKYAHVTYFFDGGVDKELKGADRILVPSPKVATYDLKPEMSAYEVTDKVVDAILSEKYDTIILNYANCDMVGHTAVFDAAVKAVETVDTCVGRVYDAIMKVGGTMVLTADHGNADMIWDEHHNPFSAHTTNPVPFLITNENVELRKTGNLGDIAPTMLDLLGITKPVEMTGTSMIAKRK